MKATERRGFLLATALTFAGAWLGLSLPEACAGTCGKCSGVGRYWAGFRGWVKCDRCEGAGYITDDHRTPPPSDPTWPTRITVWSVSYPNRSMNEGVIDVYTKIAANTWQRVLYVTPFATGVQRVQDRYQLAETGLRGSDGSGPYLDLDDAQHSQVLRLRPARMDIFRRAQPRWDSGVYIAAPDVAINCR